MKKILPILPLGAAVLAACGFVSAGTQQTAPDGLPAGPVLFAPWFESEFLVDSNVFSSLNPVPDVVTTVRAGVTAYVPIRMSDLQIGYTGNTYFYRDAVFEGTETHEGSALFNLNFSNYSTLTLKETYTSGTTERQAFEDSDEPVSIGIPFSRNRFAVEWLRDVANQPSWKARVEHWRHSYDTVVDNLPWLDYEGWDVEYSYAQPFYRRGALTGRYEARRQDHFESGEPNVAEDGPLRREVYDALEVGYSGIVGRRQPLYVSLGYGRFGLRDVQRSDDYKHLPPPTDYRGLVGSIRWRLPVGTNNVEISASRAPLASSLNTYYLVNDLRVTFDRRFLEVSRYGVLLLTSRNAYGESVTRTANELGATNCGEDLIRRDQQHRIQGFWEWFIQPRIALRITADRTRRNSNCETANFRSDGLGLMLRTGWF